MSVSPAGNRIRAATEHCWQRAGNDGRGAFSQATGLPPQPPQMFASTVASAA